MSETEQAGEVRRRFDAKRLIRKPFDDRLGRGKENSGTVKRNYMTYMNNMKEEMSIEDC